MKAEIALKDQKLNQPTPSGQHLAPLPADPDTLVEILRANTAGIDTCMAATYAAMAAQGIEPDAWRLAP